MIETTEICNVTENVVNEEILILIVILQIVTVVLATLVYFKIIELKKEIKKYEKNGKN